MNHACRDISDIDAACCILHSFVHVDDDHQQVEEEEQSIIKGLLPCVVGIVGVALAIWFGVYLNLPLQSRWILMNYN